ncbi:MAG: hypothetical protein WCP35_10755 [Verrucomicrobiota bacterium]
MKKMKCENRRRVAWWVIRLLANGQSRAIYQLIAPQWKKSSRHLRQNNRSSGELTLADNG